MTPIETLPLIPAPGAKAAKFCGILAIILALTCVGVPVALVLAVIAIAQYTKARGCARLEPGIYEVPSVTGLVTGIIALVLPLMLLPVVGIAASIAIPAYVNQ